MTAGPPLSTQLLLLLLLLLLPGHKGSCGLSTTRVRVQRQWQLLRHRRHRHYQHHKTHQQQHVTSTCELLLRPNGWRQCSD